MAGGAALVSKELDSGGKAVVAGFGLEGVHGELQGGTTRAGLLKAILDWFATPVGVDTPDLPPAPSASLQLAQNHPNPFNPRTEIAFLLPQPGPATLRVFDARGSLVRTLLNADLAAGHHFVTWDGRNRAGQPVASGLYVYTLGAAGQTQARRMILLK